MSSITFTQVGQYEDNHGIVHTDAVFILTHYSKRSDTAVSGYLQTDSSELEYQETTNDNKSFDYGVQFWTNETARLAGKDPMQFRSEGNAHFTFSPESNPTTHANIRLACKDHFLTEILAPHMITSE